MADYYTRFACLLPLGRPENVSLALNILGALSDELEGGGECLGFEAEYVPVVSNIGLLLTTGSGSGDPDHVASFALRCAEAFDLAGQWGFCWAHTCSRERLDAFGGGSVLLDLSNRTEIARLDCSQWLDAQVASSAVAA